MAGSDDSAIHINVPVPPPAVAPPPGMGLSPDIAAMLHAMNQQTRLLHQQQ